jgi:hypothetical protein
MFSPNTKTFGKISKGIKEGRVYNDTNSGEKIV